MLGWLLVDAAEAAAGGLVLGLLAAALAHHLHLRRRLSACELRLTALEGAAPARHRAAADVAVDAAQRGGGVPASTVPEAIAAPPARSEAPRPEPPPVPPRTPTAAEPARRPTPGWFTRFISGGNWLVRGGVLLLFLGVGFLLKFAADNALLPVPLRLLGVSLGGIVLIGIGLWQAPRRRAYGLTLQGAGVGLLYLTLYAAFRLYGLLPAGVAFSLMLGVVLAAGWLALRHDAMVLAVLGTLGGLAAPVLASTGSGSHVSLFAYYAVLNAGVLWLSLRRSWRALHLTGFVCTFGVSVLWGSRFYRPEFLVSVEPFLVLFFAMYLAVAIAYAVLRELRLKDPMDATLVFGTPLVAFALQSRLLADRPLALALSALVLAVVYVCAAFALRRVGRPGLGVLVEAFWALAVGFATVSIALAMDARWTSASWALEGAALVWVGWRQRRWLARLAGGALQLLAGGAWLLHLLESGRWEQGEWLGTVMLALAGLVSGLVLNRPPPTTDPVRSRDAAVLSLLLGIWGLAWWLLGGTAELLRQTSDASAAGAVLLFLSASAAGLFVLGTRGRWRLPTGVALGLPLGLLAVVAVEAILAGLAAGPAAATGPLAALLADHPLAGLGALAWPVALLTVALLAWSSERHALAVPVPRWRDAMLVLWVWLLGGVAAWELAWWAMHALPAVASWQRLAWLLPPVVLTALATLAVTRAVAPPRWPVAGRERLALVAAVGPLLAAAVMGLLAQSAVAPGLPWPWPYLPLLNPVDLVGLVTLAVAWRWQRATRSFEPDLATAAAVALAGVAFVWLNLALLRALHALTAVAWRAEALFQSTLVQASVSLLWGVTGLLVMLGASRAGSRPAWFTGAGLMLVVVLKLMLVDLASTGTVARIVSFISVGLLMMLVGYLAPVPPREAEARLEADAASAPER